MTRSTSQPSSLWSRSVPRSSFSYVSLSVTISRNCFNHGRNFQSYLIGLWFSLRTHATQIWQNPQQLLHPEIPGPGSNRVSVYQKLVPSVLRHSESVGQKIGRNMIPVSGQPNAIPMPQPESIMQSTTTQPERRISYTQQPSVNLPPAPGIAPLLETVDHAIQHTGLQPTALPETMTREDFTRAVAVATVSALRHQEAQAAAPGRYRVGGQEVDDGAAGGHGGHDAPSWSRFTSASVLLACTALYAVIAGTSASVSLKRFFINRFAQNCSSMWWMLYLKGLASTKSSSGSPCLLSYRIPRSS